MAVGGRAYNSRGIVSSMVYKAYKARESGEAERMKGYLIIPVWLFGNVATMAFLILTFVMSKVKKSKAGKPYFEIRSIASVKE